MAYIGTSPSNGVRRIHTYTATAGQTTFTGSSTEGVTLTYADTNYIDVFQNGVLLGSADYTSTSGTSVVLAQGASVSDLVVIVVYDVFSVADTVSKTAGGNFDSGVTMSSTLAVTGATTLSSSLAMTSDDPTITMTDSSGTNDIGTIQATSGALIFTARDGSSDGEIIFKMSDGTTTSNTMRINNGGKLLINTTSALGSGQGVLHLKGANANTVCNVQTATNGEAGFIFINASGTAVGNVTINSSATVYSTSSDYRLKENVSYDFDATTRLKQLKPCRFNFIADADTTVDGFLAHEVSSIVPEAISGEKDALEDDGKIKPQGIDHGKIVPLLVKTIQELEARITALESK